MRRLVCWVRGHRREMKTIRGDSGFVVVSHCGRCDRVFWGIE